MKFPAVIFDMDGLMFDTESLFYESHAHIATIYDKAFSPEIQVKLMGQKPLHVIQIILRELGLTREDPQKVLEERDKKYLELAREKTKVMPGLLELLSFLKANKVRMAIASSSDRDWIEFLLNKFDIRDYFELIVSGQDVQHGKPSPDIYIKAVEQLGLKPEQCLVLEDALNGVKAGRAAGCFTVAVPGQFNRREEFIEADYVASSLADGKIREFILSL